MEITILHETTCFAVFATVCYAENQSLLMDIPLSAVISDTVGPIISDVLAHDPHSAFVVRSVTKDSDGYLIPAGGAEEIWAYDDLGEKWGTGGRMPQETVGNE